MSRRFRRLLELLLLSALLGQHALGALHYVDAQSANPVPPYTNWANAALTIQDAVDAAANSDQILVANGWYNKGGGFAAGVSNRVAITKALTIQSVSGSAFTTIEGIQAQDSTNKVRCVYLADGAALVGFTLTNGSGGVWGQSAAASLSNCVVTGNIDTGANNVTMLNCSLLGNQVVGGSAMGGGAAGCNLTNCVLSGNSARWTGGGAIGCTLSGCVLSSNSGGAYGGGAANCILYDCTIDGNHATKGGGAYSSTLTNCTLVNNTATDGGGTFGGGNLAVLYHCTLRGNSAENGGAAAEAILVSCVMTGNAAWYGAAAYNCRATNCLLSGNQATGGSGGGAMFGTLQGCTLSFNSADIGAGASQAALINCALLTNSASSTGGGSVDSTLNSCVVVGNRANLGGGIAQYYEVPCVANNCTVVGNYATSAGGGAYSGDVFNSIVYYNDAPVGPNISTTTNVSYCCTFPLPADGLANLTNEPSFVDLASGNLDLRPNSPLIDSGSNSYATNSLDFLGRPRISGATVDIGAYEFQSLDPFHAWLEHYRLPTDGSADFLDSDLDGLNNWQEWVADTIPTNAASVLRVERADLLLPGPRIALTWPSSSSRLYFLQRSTNLLQPAASITIQTNITGFPGTTTFTDTNPPSNCPAWYRVAVQQPL
ncbi:MAG TPA: choice-of-anchor Q domain-containing protein [Verrucomicrobiae bacterium]